MSTIFQPKSFFFTDPNSITQDALRSFGPQSANVFNITASFQSSGAKAYAICKGTVLIQPQTGNSNLVNLILRPFSQPINGLPICYFVYRGLRLQDFFNGNLVKDAGTNESDYINKAQQAFENYYTSIEQAKPVFEAKYIGYDPANQSAELDIDSLFFKQAQYQSGEEELQHAFELPMVQAGHSLGYFAQGECGMDVILSYGDYKLENPIDEFAFNLEYARAPLATIDITNVSDEYKAKRIKEQVQQFIDIVAFYGFHAGNGTVSVYEGSAVAKKKETAIYDAIVSKFYSKHRLYLYIQSDRGRSYDFYGNYTLEPDSEYNIKTGISNTVLTEDNFGTNGWPIHIIEAAQAHDSAENDTYIQLVTDSNPEAMLYVQVGTLVNASKNNFMSAEGLRAPEDINRISILAYTPDLILRNSATLGTSRYTIATFNKLIYQGVQLRYFSPLKEEGDRVDQIIPDFFDDIFEISVNTSLYNTSSHYQSISFQLPKLINYYADNVQQSILAVQSIKIDDSIPELEGELIQKRTTYVTEQLDQLNKSLSNQVSFDSINTPSGLNTSTSQTYVLPPPYRLELVDFSDESIKIKGLKLKTESHGTPLKVLLGMSDFENQQLITLIKDNTLINPRIILTNFDKEVTIYTSPEKVQYKKYVLMVSGEDELNQISLYQPNTTITLYEIDNNYHFSAEYSKNMTRETPQLTTDVYNYKETSI